MFATRELVDSFHQYALCELNNSGAIFTIDELYCRWRELREREETIRDVQRGLEQIERGECMTLDELRRRVEENIASPANV